jgi:hypothetical protein
MALPRLTILCAGVALAIGAAPARADFYSNSMFPVGESAGSMGGAAVAWVSDGSAAWYNPAGLGISKERTLSANVSAYGIQSVKVKNFIDFGIQNGVDSKSTLHSNAVATFPSYVGYVQNFGKSATFRQGLGFAVVVPDFERADALIDVPSGQNPAAGSLEARARLKVTAQTIWAMPAWGGCWNDGGFCIGAALALGYRTDIETDIVDVRALGTGNMVFGQQLVDQHDLWMALIGGTVGFQVRALPNLRLGASLRTPVTTIVGGGSVLHSSASNYPGATDTLSLVEEQKPRLNYNLPLQIRAGASLILGDFHLALDVNFSPGQSQFAFIRGQFGETQLQPRYFGMPMGEPVDIFKDLKRGAIIDAAFGVEYIGASGWGLVAGIFTNFTGAAEGSEDNTFGDRVGFTFGGVRRSGRSTTRLGGAVVVGGGRASGIAKGADGMIATTLVDTSSVALYATLGGTADL